jgi:hypothetical protein
MDARRNARTGLVCLIAVGLAFTAFAAVPGAVVMGRGSVTFVGVIQTLPEEGLIGEWTVAGVKVNVTDQTTIDQGQGEAIVGAVVKVKGELQTDLSVTASRVDVMKLPTPPHGPPQEKSFAVLHLTATDAAPDAAGVVVTRTFTYADGSAREDLKVGVCHLVPDTEYGVFVFVDEIEVPVGVIDTDEDGEGHLFLSTAGQPGAEPLPEELQPLTELKWVEVRAGETAVLFGDFDDARRHDSNHPWVDYLALAVLQDDEDNFVGFAAAAIDGEEQELKFGLWGLIPGQLYTLFVNDDVALGTFQASQGGTLVAEFSTAPKGNELPFPEGMLGDGGLASLEELLSAEVESGGATVASGTFSEAPTALASGGGRLRRRFGH